MENPKSFPELLGSISWRKAARQDEALHSMQQITTKGRCDQKSLLKQHLLVDVTNALASAKGMLTFTMALAYKHGPKTMELFKTAQE